MTFFRHVDISSVDSQVCRHWFQLERPLDFWLLISMRSFLYRVVGKIWNRIKVVFVVVLLGRANSRQIKEILFKGTNGSGGSILFLLTRAPGRNWSLNPTNFETERGKFVTSLSVPWITGNIPTVLVCVRRTHYSLVHRQQKTRLFFLTFKHCAELTFLIHPSPS